MGNRARGEPAQSCNAQHGQPANDLFQITRARRWCGRGDLNSQGFPRQILSLVRLPISPRPHGASLSLTGREARFLVGSGGHR